GYPVALHVSAWIEIARVLSCVCTLRVALHVSAWIEIHWYVRSATGGIVALHVSAWIEINARGWDERARATSHSM
ncbi:hypothetical protein YS28_004662, partial [Salmonella enterica subsp. enterica]|nr:hypothetical protein [Salmonella enterica subsp. enterica]